MRCNEPTTPYICGRANIDDSGFIGVSFPESGPGAFFHFQLREEEVARTRLTCQTIGLAAANQLDRGVERCEMVKNGSLAEMTIIVDSRCDRLRITMFDDAYRAQDHNAAKVSPCDAASPERLAAPPLLCGPLATFRKDP